MAVHYHPRPTPRTGTLTPPTLLLLALATACVAGVIGVAGASAVTTARARAGVAGGAGAAELAEVAEREAAEDSSPPTGGTIREALGGGVVEQGEQGEHVERGVVADGDRGGETRTGSQCNAPQICVRVEHCPSANTDFLFQCAPGWVCCVPRTASQHGATHGASHGVDQRHPVVHPPPPSPPTTPSPASAQPYAPQRPSPQGPAGQQQASRPVTASGDRTSPKTPTPTTTTTTTRRSTTKSPQRGTPTTTTAMTTSATQSQLLPDTKECGKVQTENRITNGKIASLGQFPWMALLGFRIQGIANVTFICGGTLINERYVLTAAHCFNSHNSLVTVRLGEFNLTEPVDCDHNNVCAPAPQDIGVERVIVHPEYNTRNIKHDIALVRLRRSVGEYSDFVRPICLPIGLNVTDEKKFKIAGWGKTDLNHESGSPVLQFTDVPGVNHAECSEVLQPVVRPLGPGQLCAGGEKGKDACRGDSGGPLMVTLVLEPDGPDGDLPPSHVTYQMGIVSFGPDSPCGTTQNPSVYTRVAAYVPWIVGSLRP